MPARAPALRLNSLVLTAVLMAGSLLASPLLSGPAAAQDAPADDDGWSLMREGAGLLFDGLRSEIDPALQDMAEAFAGAEPMLRDLLGMMDDLTSYHAPEVLPNGDIIIRRKTPAEIAAEPAPEIEL